MEHKEKEARNENTIQRRTGVHPSQYRYGGRVVRASFFRGARRSRRFTGQIVSDVEFNASTPIALEAEAA
jgi:hypothetical protein